MQLMSLIYSSISKGKGTEKEDVALSFLKPDFQSWSKVKEKLKEFITIKLRNVLQVMLIGLLQNEKQKNLKICE